LVGVYAGEQEEEVYHHPGAGRPLQLVARRRLHPGDCYVLLPPEEDIHRVTTLSARGSISIHLLGNDTGCTWRHRYQLDRAGYPLPARGARSPVPRRLSHRPLRPARQAAADAAGVKRPSGWGGAVMGKKKRGQQPGESPPAPPAPPPPHPWTEQDDAFVGAIR